MSPFNVSTDPWIPVLSGSSQKLVSIEEAISHADTIHAIGGSVLDRFCILRLLICIVQAALDGPEDESGWKSCKDNIIPVTLKYLKKWGKSFELFGENPFLQTPGIDKVLNRPIISLDSLAASGNNHTLFDSTLRCGKEKTFGTDDIVRGMLASLIFSECGKGAKPPKGMKWGSKEIKNYGKSSVANNILLTYTEGEILLDTIYLNLIPKSWLKEAKIPFGRPVWECPVTDQESLDTKSAAISYLFNLVPQTRAILIDKQGTQMSFSDGVEPCALFGAAKKGELPYRDPMGTVITKTEGKKVMESYLKVDPDKMPWIDLQSILQVSNRKELYKGPWSLRHLIYGSCREITLTTGGFAYDKAKPVTVCEWKLKIPGGILNSRAMNLYATLIDIAQQSAGSVRYALETYLDLIEKKLSIEEKKNRKIYQSMLSNAVSKYWHNLDKYAAEMIKILSEDQDKAQQMWYKHIRYCALEAFSETCGRYKKNISMYVIALNTLKGGLKNVGNKNSGTGKETDR